MKKLLICLIISIFCASLNQAMAENETLTQTASVRKFVNDFSNEYQFSNAYLYQLIGQAKFDQRVIQKMEMPYEAKPWLEYKKHFITPERIALGIKFWSDHKAALDRAEQLYGIPSDIIVAILGMETRYGIDEGEYSVMNSLVTLAFYYPPKAEYFQKELGKFIFLSHILQMPPYSIKGSYAGALGMPQFMPSSYLYYAVNSQGRFKNVNLFKNKEDAIYSIANFLMQNGWERDQPIAVEAKIMGNQFEKILKKDPNKPVDPKNTLEKLATYQVYSDDNNDSRMNGYWSANLMNFKGETPEYWLGFHNFYVLTRYNNNDQYAMTAFFLGKILQRDFRKYLNNKAKDQKMENKTNQPQG